MFSIISLRSIFQTCAISSRSSFLLPIKDDLPSTLSFGAFLVRDGFNQDPPPPAATAGVQRSSSRQIQIRTLPFAGALLRFFPMPPKKLLSLSTDRIVLDCAHCHLRLSTSSSRKKSEGRCCHRPSPSPHPPPHHHTTDEACAPSLLGGPWRNYPPAVIGNRFKLFAAARSTRPCPKQSPKQARSSPLPPEPDLISRRLRGRAHLLYCMLKPIRRRLFRQSPPAVAAKLDHLPALGALNHRAIRFAPAAGDDRDDAECRPAMPLRQHSECLRFAQLLRLLHSFRPPRS